MNSHGKALIDVYYALSIGRTWLKDLKRLRALGEDGSSDVRRATLDEVDQADYRRLLEGHLDPVSYHEAKTANAVKTATLLNQALASGLGSAGILSDALLWQLRLLDADVEKFLVDAAFQKQLAISRCLIYSVAATLDTSEAEWKAAVNDCEAQLRRTIYATALTSTYAEDSRSAPTEDHCARSLTIDSAESPPQDARARLPKAVQVAYAMYQYAEGQNESPGMDDREAYEWLKTQDLPGEQHELPSFESWSRYLRRARKELGEQKYSPRAGRPHGRSIADWTEVESPRQSGRGTRNG